MKDKKIRLRKLKEAIYIVALLTNFGLSSYAIKGINDIKNERKKEIPLEDQELAEVREIPIEGEETAEVEENIESKNTLSITREEAEKLFMEEIGRAHV